MAFLLKQLASEEILFSLFFPEIDEVHFAVTDCLVFHSHICNPNVYCPIHLSFLNLKREVNNGSLHIQIHTQSFLSLNNFQVYSCPFTFSS